MANKALESTVLSIEVQSVALIVADLLSANTRNFYVTELSQIQE